jgi:hypothetical protein
MSTTRATTFHLTQQVDPRSDLVIEALRKRSMEMLIQATPDYEIEAGTAGVGASAGL